MFLKKNNTFMQGFSNDSGYVAKCPVCKKKYRKEDSVILEAGNDRNVVHFTCGACRTSSLVLISQSQAGTIGVGMLTDLDGSEVADVFNGESITADNVLHIHSLLKSL